MSDVKAGLWQNVHDGKYIKVRGINQKIKSMVDCSDEGCANVYTLSIKELAESYELREPDAKRDRLARVKQSSGIPQTLARHGSLDEYVDSLPAYESQPVVDDTFNDDLEVTTFGDLDMVHELAVKDSSIVGYGKNEIQVALCSDGAIYFKRSDLASFLNLTRAGIINSYKRNIGAKESVRLMVKSSDGQCYPTAFISESQLIRYLEKRCCFYSRKMLRWLNKSDFFGLENSVAEVPVQTLNDEQKRYVNFDAYQLISDGAPAQVCSGVSDNDMNAVPYASFDLAAGDDKSVTCDFFSIPDDTPMRLIGIHGPARSGKDTLASYLLDNLSDDWTRSAFADPLKAMLTVIGVDCSDEAKVVVDDAFGVTPRHMMQTLGTEWGRHMVDGDIWVKAFARLNAGKCVIVPDVRFENEAALAREHGVLIHLTGRGGIEGNHVSENPIELKEGDIVIDNSGSLNFLYWQVDNNQVLDRFVGEVSE